MRKVIFSLICILATTLLCSCEEPRVTQTSSDFVVWYLNSQSNALTSLPSTATADLDVQSIARDLIEEMEQVPQQADAIRAYPDTVTFMDMNIDGSILTLNFDSNYNLMQPARKVLCNAAIARTFTQIEGIEYVRINSGTEGITDQEGRSVGLLSASDFVDRIANVNSYTSSDVTLYFLDEGLQKLVPQQTSIVYDIDTAIHQVIVEQLIKGPASSGMRNVISANTKLISVSINDSVCTVNLGDGFLRSPEGVDGNITIYAIVNSLTELPNISQVQLCVNGARDVRINDSISLDRLFERDESYIISEDDIVESSEGTQ